MLTLWTLLSRHVDDLTSWLSCLNTLSRTEIEKLGMRFISRLMEEHLDRGSLSLVQLIEHHDSIVVKLISTFILHLAEVEAYRQEIASSQQVIKALGLVTR
jgi:hypothetical protein